MWYDYIENSSIINDFYNEIPDLNYLYIGSFVSNYDNNGQIDFEFNKTVDKLPQRWINFNYKYVSFKLIFEQMSSLNIRHKLNSFNENRGNIIISKLPTNDLKILIESTFDIEIIATKVSIDLVSGFR